MTAKMQLRRIVIDDWYPVLARSIPNKVHVSIIFGFLENALLNFFDE